MEIVIRPTSPLGSCPFAELPHELMAEVFLHLDPHTLYTSIRFLNRDWKETVESHIIPMLFATSKWRIALRIHRRPLRKTLPNGPLAAVPQLPESLRFNESAEARTARVESTPGAWEDELQPPTTNPDESAKTVTQYIPLELKKVDPAGNRFQFTTGQNWYALYELDERALGGDDSFRLNLDYGVAWRFDGDGKDQEEQRPGGWTKLDQENGWLSKFYCSAYDLSTPRSSRANGQGNGLHSHPHPQPHGLRLNATMLSRRRRMPAGPPPKEGAPVPMTWDDSHLDYFHLDLALGTEFFVRRSARANLLMRALEAEAARRERLGEPGSSEMDENQLTSPRPYLQRTAPGSRNGGGGSGGLVAGTPPPSRSSPNQLRPDMSPAEQLQMMAKSKAAAKAAGSMAHGNNLPQWARPKPSSKPGSRVASRVASRNASQASSLAPSRVVSRSNSRAPTRPGSPVNGGPSEVSTPLGATPMIPGTPVASPRDMPFFRAAALSLSTASPFTHEALSGYTTPNTLMGAHSFALRGGGGAEPGGTPTAEFKARMRRAIGFEGCRGPEPDATATATARKTRARSGTATYASMYAAMALSASPSPGAAPDPPGHKWHKVTSRDGVDTEWRWARMVEPDAETYEGDLEKEWVWSR